MLSRAGRIRPGDSERKLASGIPGDGVTGVAGVGGVGDVIAVCGPGVVGTGVSDPGKLLTLCEPLRAGGVTEIVTGEISGELGDELDPEPEPTPGVEPEFELVDKPEVGVTLSGAGAAGAANVCACDCDCVCTDCNNCACSLTFGPASEDTLFAMDAAIDGKEKPCEPPAEGCGVCGPCVVVVGMG